GSLPRDAAGDGDLHRGCGAARRTRGVLAGHGHGREAVRSASTGPPRMQDAFIGVGKSAVFAAVAAMIAFRKGLNATGGSDAVGRVATAAVVSSLAAVTLVNAVITGLQNVLIAAQLMNK